MVNNLGKIESKERHIRELQDSFESTENVFLQIYLFIKIGRKQRRLKRLIRTL